VIKSILVAFSLLMFSGCVQSGSLGTSEPAKYVEDTVLVAKVKTAMVQQKGLEGFSIHVNAYQGVVQLSGFIDNDVNKELAGQIARSVDGVQEVVNNLIVKQ
jgi:hyperosmotically inducible protein